jgi:hypothetical protein
LLRRSWRASTDSLRSVIANSFTFSTAAVVLIVILGILIGYLLARRESLAAGALDSMLLVPYIVPGVVMGLAFVVTFNVPPLQITGTAAIIVLMLFIRHLLMAPPDVVDAGKKTMSGDAAMPAPSGLPPIAALKLSAEHSKIELEQPSDIPKIGDKIEFIVGHSDTTVHLHEEIVGIRSGRIASIWQVAGRGKIK